MIPKEIIQLAIEKGGYISEGKNMSSWKLVCIQTVLDPLFWQALVRALDLQSKYKRRRGDYLEAWSYYAHQYFDLILTNSDTAKFWEELLTSRVSKVN